MAGWVKAGAVEELKGFFVDMPPIPTTNE